jgi:hypothetical protein
LRYRAEAAQRPWRDNVLVGCLANLADCWKEVTSYWLTDFGFFELTDFSPA